MCKDYQAQSAFDVRFGESTAIDLPKSNVLQFVTEDGGVVSARPSGTEPKIKFYCSVNAPLDSAKRYRDVARELDTRRSEEHTSELQSRGHLVCRLLLE